MYLITKSSFFFTILILFNACTFNDEEVESNNVKYVINLDNKVFDINNNSFITKYNIIKNPYEISITDKFMIFSRVENGDEPEVYTLDIDNNITTKITNNDFIEFNPVINNDGIYAYALSEYSVSRSKIYVNEVQLPLDDSKLYKNLAINKIYLLFSDSENYIYIYNLSNKKIETFYVDGFIEKIHFISDRYFAIQYFSQDTNSMDIAYYDLMDKQLLILLDSDKDEIIKYNSTINNLIISKINNNQKNIKLLFNALHAYYGNKLASPFARSNNFMGRIGWNQSKKLEELLDLYSILEDDRILLQIELIIRNLLSLNNGSLNIINEFNSEYSYATKKYSLDYVTDISFIVHDAKIYYAMLRCVNELKTLDKTLSSTVSKRAESIYNYYNSYYDFNKNLYRFQYGMEYKYDGVWIPYNMQNSFGLMLIELYKFTNKQEYSDRVIELAQQFNKELTYIKNMVIWHYMPSIYYIGWNNEDNISINLPSKIASIDLNFEDTLHAGLNAEFIMKFYHQFPNIVFQETDIVLLNNTLENLISNDNFSKFLNINSEMNIFSYNYFLKDGWSLLNNNELKDISTKLTPSFMPDFDTTTNHYINNINIDDLQDEKLKIIEIVFDNNLTKIKSLETEYSLHNIQKYFESR